MKCAYYDKEFTPQRSTRRFCSDRCRINMSRPGLRGIARRLFYECAEWENHYRDLAAEYDQMREKTNAELDRLYDTYEPDRPK
jgi:hypothetical protein